MLLLCYYIPYITMEYDKTLKVAHLHLHIY